MPHPGEEAATCGDEAPRSHGAMCWCCAGSRPLPGHPGAGSDWVPLLGLILTHCLHHDIPAWPQPTAITMAISDNL